MDQIRTWPAYSYDISIHQIWVECARACNCFQDNKQKLNVDGRTEQGNTMPLAILWEGHKKLIQRYSSFQKGEIYVGWKLQTRYFYCYLLATHWHLKMTHQAGKTFENQQHSRNLHDHVLFKCSWYSTYNIVYQKWYWNFNQVTLNRKKS